MNWATTKAFILQKIEKQNGSEFSFDLLNSLSWAVGSMYGNIPEHEEKPFLIAVIRVIMVSCRHYCISAKPRRARRTRQSWQAALCMWLGSTLLSLRATGTSSRQS